MPAKDEWDGSESEDEGEQAPVCEQCGAEEPMEFWSDGGEHVVYLCDACAHPPCGNCGKRIEGMPHYGWMEAAQEMAPLCQACYDSGEFPPF